MGFRRFVRRYCRMYVNDSQSTGTLAAPSVSQSSSTASTYYCQHILEQGQTLTFGELVGFTVTFLCFPTERDLVSRKTPQVRSGR